MKAQKFALLFLVVAALCAIPRFGQRENANRPELSDSDVYLNLARVLTGEEQAFSEGSLLRPHHLSRPALCFLAGWSAKLFPLNAAFSVWNILFSTLLAWLLWRVLEHWKPNHPLNWFPSILFLTSFVQMNWGYHILTDTAGFATVMLVMYVANRWFDRIEKGHSPGLPEIAGMLCLFWVLSAIAFLTRETGLLSVCVVAVYAFRFWRAGTLSRHFILLAAVGAILLAGKIPHILYQKHFQTVGVPMALSFSHLLRPKFFFDAAAKSIVAFHFAWPFLLWALAKQWRSIRLPPFLQSWGLACFIYIGGGYFVNSLIKFPYPLRMTFSLFPLAYLLVACFFLNISTENKRRVGIALFLAAHLAVSLIGIYFDPGQEGLALKETVMNFLKRGF